MKVPINNLTRYKILTCFPFLDQKVLTRYIEK